MWIGRGGEWGGGTYDSTVADLNRLKDMQEEFGGLARHQPAVSGGGGVVDFPRAVDGRHGRCEVGQNAGEADEVGLAGHFVEGEGVFDGLLRGRQLGMHSLRAVTLAL